MSLIGDARFMSNSIQMNIYKRSSYRHAILTDKSRNLPTAMQKNTVVRLPMALIMLYTMLPTPVFAYWLMMVPVTSVSMLKWKILLIEKRNT